MHHSQSQSKKKVSNRPHPGTPRPSLDNLPHSKLNYELEQQKKLEKLARLQQRNKQSETSTNVTPKVAPPKPTPSSENLPKFLIWVKNEPFDFGILSPHPCPKIGINILRKIAEYCRDKPGHYPELSLNQWNHICKYKIQLSNPDLCTAYFRVFDILSRPVRQWTGGEVTASTTSNSPMDTSTPDVDGDEPSTSTISESRDVKFYKMLNQGHDANEEFKADTLQFLLFLYIQHFLRLHRKFSMRGQASGDEPWPKFWTNRAGNAQSSANVIPEQLHAEFLTVNLEDMIDFLMILREKKAPPQNEPRSGRRQSKVDSPAFDLDYEGRVSLQVIRALSLILGAASVTHDKEFRSLEDCLKLNEIARQLDYDKGSLTVDKKRFMRWLVSNLKINPWGPSSVPLPQVPVSLMTGLQAGEEVKDKDKEQEAEGTGAEIFQRNKIFWNTQCYPKAWFLISNVYKQTLLLDSVEPLSSIKISRCTDSNLYLPGVHNMVLIQKCHGLILNVGVATKVVKVQDCSNLTLSGVGRLFIICDSVSCTFHLLTPSSPLICGNKNHMIQLAPYNTSYPELETHMKHAGISPKVQKWNKPLELSSDGFPYDHLGHDSNVSVLRAAEFKTALFPFKPVEGSGASRETSPFSPSVLSSSYQQRLSLARENVDKVKKEFNIKLLPPSKYRSKESINLIYKITLDRFKKWLRETGNYEQIVGLLSLQKSLEGEVFSPIVLSTQQDLACVSKSLKKFFSIGTSPNASPLYGSRLRMDGSREKQSSRRESEDGLLKIKGSHQEGANLGAGESLPQKKKSGNVSVRYQNQLFNSLESMYEK